MDFRLYFWRSTMNIGSAGGVTMIKRCIRLAVILFLTLPVLSLPLDLYAQSLGFPLGKVILTVSGNIGHTNSGDKAVFDVDMLEAFGVSTLELETPWTEGRQVFSGVLGSKILDAVAARGEIIVARAINDYRVKIPVSDFRRYPVLFALKQNERYMRVRDKGPIWVVYPWETFPELDNEETREKWIWQLSEIIIQ